MSSILKALKKLENDVSVGNDIRAGAQQPHLKISGKTAADKDPSLQKRLLIILAAAFLLVGSVMLVIFEPWKDQTTATRTAEVAVGMPPSSLVATKTSAVTQNTVSSAPHSKKDDPTGSAVGMATTAAVQNKIKEKVLSETTDSTTPMQTGTVEAKPAARQPVKTNFSLGGTESGLYKAEDDVAFASLPIKPSDESMLELQAIAWSLHPEKRMAVINGHIVREGGLIEKTRVTHIGKNEVVFTKAGKKWRQLFRPVSTF